MNIKLHECNWRVNSEIVKLFITDPTDPCKVSLVEMRLEELSAMRQYSLRVILIEGVEEFHN
jgi:hypothetical protein